MVFDWLQEAAFPNQALGRSILGTTSRVASFSQEDLFGFVREHYTADRMILSAAGAVDHDEIVRLCEGLFGHLPRGSGEVLTPAHFSGGERREVRTLEQVHFALGFESAGYQSPDIYASQIYANVLGGGMSSRLFQEVREKRGLCYSIFAQAGAYADTGMITIYAGTSESQIGELAELTVAELARSTESLTPTELSRARAQMKAGLLMGLESPSARTERLARLLAIWDRVPPLEETIAHIDAVTTEDVRRFAGNLAQNGRAAMALYGPVKNAPELVALQGRLAA